MKTALYRHFDKDENLLYVGISLNVIRRTREHSHESMWFDNISKIIIDRFKTRIEAEKAEIEAIKKENPRFNKLIIGFPRSEVLKIRLSNAELAAFKSGAEISGLPVSAWARCQLRNAAHAHFGAKKR